MELTIDDISCLYDRNEKSCLRRAKRKHKHHVFFTLATEYTFHVGYGESTLPGNNLPGVGLSGMPIKVECTNLKSEDKKGIVCKYTNKDRYLLLQRDGLSRDDVQSLIALHQQLHDSRVQSVIEQITDTKDKTRGEEMELTRRVRACLSRG